MATTLSPAQEMALRLSSTPEQWQAYLDRAYPETSTNPGSGRAGDRLMMDASMDSSGQTMGERLMRDVPQAHNAEPISGALADFEPASGQATPPPQVPGLTADDVPLFTPGTPNAVKPKGVALVDSHGNPTAAARGIAPVDPSTIITGDGTAAAAAQPVASFASAPTVASGMSVTPNYYLGSGAGAVPATTAGAVPVSYGVATGGQAPAGTVTPSGNTVAANSAPAAGAVGGGGTAPGGMPGALTASSLVSGLQGLGQAASGFIAAGAVPQVQMPTVNPVLADFPIVPIQQHAAPMG